METSDSDFVLEFCKTMADKNRVKIIGYLSQQEYSLPELAQIVKLKEPAVQHHITRLQKMSMVSMRTEDSTQYFRFNERQMDSLSKRIFSIEDINPRANGQDEAWIDELPLSEKDKTVIRNYTSNGRIIELHEKREKILPILRWLIREFELEKEYTEAEVNKILEPFNEDYASLRRSMIDLGFMGRDRGGRKYWLASNAFDL